MWEKIYDSFIVKDRWKYVTDGLWVTLRVTFFAVILGVILGFLVAIIRSTYDKTTKHKILDVLRNILTNSPQKLNTSEFLKFILKYFLNLICNVYLTVVRGTPVVVQLLIINFVIFASSRINTLYVAILAFGINSGAYVAEIIRGGIMSVDEGQFEAGRSLGFTYNQTLIYIILPQAFKNVLPALANEFIVLLKETSVAGYIALQDLTKAGDIIRSRTFDAFTPLIAVALIYLAMVMVFTKLVRLLERRLRSNER